MTSISQQARDWWVKGFQLNKCYIDDWDEIKSHFSRYGLSLNKHGPIITMNELKYVREAVNITEQMSKNNKYQQIDTTVGNWERKGRIFMFNMYVLPYFARTVSLPFYRKWVEEPDEYIKNIYEDIYNRNGTMKDKESKIEERIRNAIIFLRKK